MDPRGLSIIAEYARISGQNGNQAHHVISLRFEPVLNALAKWIFRPGELNGERVAVKVLLGIPLSLPE